MLFKSILEMNYKEIDKRYSTLAESNCCLSCVGDCGSVAKNRTGKICSSDYRPVKELMELGFSAYFESNPV